MEAIQYRLDAIDGWDIERRAARVISRLQLDPDAAFSTLCALPMLLGPDTVARFIGFSQPRELRDLGVSLLLFAVFLTVTATRKRIRVWIAASITAMDVAWVLGTAALLLTRSDLFNTTGIVTAIIVALAVGDFAALQAMGIRRLTAGAPKRHDEGSPVALASGARS